jgi:hypothetical protein
MSGINELVEGTCDLRIYLLKSGSNVRGQGAIGAGITTGVGAAATAAAVPVVFTNTGTLDVSDEFDMPKSPEIPDDFLSDSSSSSFFLLQEHLLLLHILHAGDLKPSLAPPTRVNWNPSPPPARIS